MKISIAFSAAAIVCAAAMPLAAHAASFNDPAQDQAENQITAQLNQQQLQGGYGVLTYEGVVQSPHFSSGSLQEQIAQPPDDADNLSIIE
ncbi:MAG TPA: hypothetical protein VGP48_12645 [Stellaceae bacterium]|jgi:hypothetical protein|nr:hypothetical protein [Stellaceae bacterium]